MTGSFSRAGLTVKGGHATLRHMKYAAGVLVSAVVVASASPRLAGADEAMKPITIVAPGERTTNNKLALGGIAGAGLVAGAVGFYFHLDSRSASDEVGTDVFTGTAWTPAHEALVNRAQSSRTAAIAMYSVGSAFLIGAVVYWIVTDPPDETIVIQPRTAQPTFTPTPGGAVLGGTWSF
ncbi:MAG: hypothetical protein ACKV2T_04350 [Kofleriaceae bacterium]